MSETGSTLPRRQLGRYLRDLRTQTGMTIPQVAKLIERSPSTLQRLEKGESGRIRMVDIRELCKVLDADETMTAALIGLAQQANVKCWWHEFGNLIPNDFDVYLGLESAAVQLNSYSPDAVIGLLQHPDYARVLIRAVHPDISAEELDQRIHLKQRRQTLITRKRGAARLEVVLGEAALRRVVGSGKVMAWQLKHLADTGTLPNVSIRVLPFSAGIPLGDPLGLFTILSFGTDAKGQDVEPPVVYLENFTGDMYLEKPADVQRYYEAHKAIQHAALDEKASRDLFRQVAREHCA
ncbi:helix-turn-helix domain-containing protein [Nocardia cyriacigeorgica]|uniref:helix-turn-helix domain-containing protein n=1 Tax=Nocardia cyriacigeorgica TaxID=135487 RepID=UPI0018943C77|nr:helix-turn-helix transcriptional regulator [Nocardia cyriacigeorgica]MBF6086118.1 helix-turn-helix domain-containing protein [Nocardia cyriacigeorgica]MBF6396802.1 helix-turn-helix domain-containing protein [Nocardia cyriacigeorgica]MBF6403540.1 helix-turn-helix domain-containing protein [Nocardia cyriacigeorgica]